MNRNMNFFSATRNNRCEGRDNNEPSQRFLSKTSWQGVVITSQKLIPFRIQLSDEHTRRRTAFTRWPKHTRFTRAFTFARTRRYMASVAFVTSCLPNLCKYVCGSHEMDGRRKKGKENAPTRMSLTFMNCSRAIPSSFFFLYFFRWSLLHAASYSPRFAAVFHKAEMFSRRWSHSYTLKAHNEIAMNTNCAWKIVVKLTYTVLFKH